MGRYRGDSGPLPILKKDAWRLLGVSSAMRSRVLLAFSPLAPLPTCTPTQPGLASVAAVCHISTNLITYQSRKGRVCQ